MSYASDTSVPIDRSQGEIRTILTKYKASGFAFMESNNKAVIVFEMNERRIKFQFDLPIHGKARTKKGETMTQKQVEQETRRLWRCMVLCVKSKLELVASGITTFESEFLSNIMLANGRTMGEVAIPQIETSYKKNEMPPLLGYGG